MERFTFGFEKLNSDLDSKTMLESTRVKDKMSSTLRAARTQHHGTSLPLGSLLSACNMIK